MITNVFKVICKFIVVNSFQFEESKSLASHKTSVKGCLHLNYLYDEKAKIGLERRSDLAVIFNLRYMIPPWRRSFNEFNHHGLNVHNYIT